MKAWDIHVRMRSVVLGYLDAEYSVMGIEVTE